MYHSEFGQDKFLDTEIFKGKKNGVFFECGALDGVMDSNSLFYEKERGWTGLCAEANPAIIETLKKNRTCAVEHCAVTNSDSEACAYIQIKGGLFGWGGLKEHIEPQHMARIIDHVKESDRQTHLVPALTLDALLTKHGITEIDYATLDIEGAEYQTLLAFPFVKYTIEIFEIENNFDNYPIEELMVKNGFEKIKRMGVSDIFRRVP